MKLEDIELKRLKKENEYLNEILDREIGKKLKSMTEEDAQDFINKYENFVDTMEKNWVYSDEELEEYARLEGIIKEIKDLEIENNIAKYLINKFFLENDDPNNTIEIDNIIRGKVAVKTAGKTGAKFGKFLGRKVKEGAVNLYNNKDEIFEKAVSSVQDKKNKTEAEYDRYKRRYSNYSAEELKEIVLDESNSTIKRRAAKDVYDEL